MCFLAVPFTPISAYGLPWHLGKIMCHIVPMSLGISGRCKWDEISSIEMIWFSLCFNIDFIGNCCRSLFCYCTSISFSYAFRCMYFIDYCHLDCWNIDLITIGNLYSTWSFEMWSKTTRTKTREKKKDSNFIHRNIGHSILHDVFLIFHR